MASSKARFKSKTKHDSDRIERTVFSRGSESSDQNHGGGRAGVQIIMVERRFRRNDILQINGNRHWSHMS